MKNKYWILVTERNPQLEVMYKDLMKCDSVGFIEASKIQKNKFIEFLYAYSNLWIAKKLPLRKLLVWFWGLFEPINKIKFDGNKNVIILNDQRLSPYYFEILKKIKRRNLSLSFVIQWLNIVESVNQDGLLDRVNKLNPALILTDDPEDAKKYNWIFWMDCMSSVKNYKSDIKSDVFFVGAAKDREDKLIDAFNKLTGAGLKCDFTIVGGKNNDARISNLYMDYEVLLEKDASTNCILEVMQECQTGYTCRAQEAIVMNKKLLTNNKWIVNSKYFNSQYIKIYEDIGADEIDFIKKDIEIDYKYDGGFSPIKLISYLEDNI